MNIEKAETRATSDRITVLLIDDSRIFRSLLEDYLRQDSALEVIGSVWSCSKAIEFLSRKVPDIIVLDAEMPDIDGLETLRKINQSGLLKGPGAGETRIFMLSENAAENSNFASDAFELGVYSVITKPESSQDESSVKIFLKDFHKKIIACVAKFRPELAVTGQSRFFEAPPAIIGFNPKIIARPAYKAILIGASTGGPKALTVILPELLKHIDLPVIISMHMPRSFTNSMIHILRARCCSRYSFTESLGGETIAPRTVHLAQGGRHLFIRKGSGGIAVTEVSDEPSEDGFCPSVNRLFCSAAEVWGGRVIAVILTGMGSDGTKGLGLLKEKGAFVIAQDEASSVVWGMPGTAVEAGCVDLILPLDAIPEAVNLEIRSRLMVQGG